MENLLRLFDSPEVWVRLDAIQILKNCINVNQVVQRNAHHPEYCGKVHSRLPYGTPDADGCSAGQARRGSQRNAGSSSLFDSS